MQIKHVQQQHSNGCGIACVAMVTNLTYSEVLDEYMHLTMRDVEDTDKLGPLSQRELDQLLIRFNIQPIRGLSEIYGEVLPGNIYIMAICSSTTKVGHYIVLDTRPVKYKMHDPLLKSSKKCKRPSMWIGLVKINQYTEFI